MRLSVEERTEIMRSAGVEPLMPYPGSLQKWLCQCNTCGSEVTPTYHNVSKGFGGCRSCANRRNAQKRWKRESSEKDLLWRDDAFMEWAYAVHLNTKSIAAYFGVTTSAVGKRLHAIGMTPRRTKIPLHLLDSWRDDSFLEWAYALHRSLTPIMQYFNVSRGVASQRLAEAGVAISPYGSVPHRLLDLWDNDQFMIWAYAIHHSVQPIQEFFETSYGIVVQRLQQLNIELQYTNIPDHLLPLWNDDDFIRWAYAVHLNARAISDFFQVSSSPVYKRLRDLSIDTATNVVPFHVRPLWNNDAFMHWAYAVHHSTVPFQRYFQVRRDVVVRRLRSLGVEIRYSSVPDHLLSLWDDDEFMIWAYAVHHSTTPFCELFRVNSDVVLRRLNNLGVNIQFSKVPDHLLCLWNNDDFIVWAYAVHGSAKAVADFFEVGSSGVLRRLRHLGIITSSSGINDRLLLLWNDDEFMKWSYAVHKSVYVLADYFGASPTGVWQRLKRIGVEMNGGGSFGESQLADFVESLGMQIKRRNRSMGFELDIFIPRKNTAIEYNGLYWHSEKVLNSSGRDGRNYHKNKSDVCRQNGIQLIHIWEDDWLERPDVVKSMISYKLGLASKGVAARKCTIDLCVGLGESNMFLGQYHIQGSTNSTVRIGLRLDGALVALGLFKQRGDNVYELVRYATSVSVPGGMGKILSEFKKNVNWQQIITFADVAVSDGSLYDRLGFSVDKVLPPDYRYIYQGQRRHKFGFRLERFRNDPELSYIEGMTERQLAELNGIPRIYDAGKVRYVMTRETPNS